MDNSFKMKLILLTALVIRYAGCVRDGEQYGFPPQFHNPNSGVFASDSSVYLPPESHTPVPYFPLKKVNNLPFPYLPPTGTKAPSIYPSPFPVILSSTLIPIFEDDDDKEHEDRNKIRISSPQPPPKPQPKNNATEHNPNNPFAQQAMRREMRLPPKMPNYHNPIDRIDMRSPVRDFPLGMTTQNPINQSPKNMIISVDTHRNDRGMDQIRASSAQNPHYIPAPAFGLSSTTEPAIPILRLSNEMDLDGSFSYEALGADQTHYVQHSHMENMGSEKEEQVVEGSYSYVGDNGQTYTVHYIADSNGFRATGEHLPVAPPIPEIIQRAVQYNLAEEAKKPPHLRAWQGEEKDYESLEKQLQYAAPVPPPRSLFTGRTPEAFSYNFGQGSSNNDNNNLAAAPSSQVPVKTNSEFIIDQTRGKSNGPIAPQVTFLASQGAHVPSLNNAQQSISRIFTTEKSAMPQLINYDAGGREAEQEANKGLWRWQYGLNPNNGNQTPDKNTISRSSGDGDDIMINFSDMTPDQYTKMLQSQIEPTTISSHFLNNNNQQNNNNFHQIHYDDVKMMNDYQNNNINNYYQSNANNNQATVSTQESTTISYSTTTPENSYRKEYITERALFHNPPSNYQKNNNVPVQKISPQAYDNPDNIYESKRIKALHTDTTTKSATNNFNAIPTPNPEQKMSYNNIWSNARDLQLHLQNEPTSITQVPPFLNTAAPKHSEVHEHITEFRPILHNKENTVNVPKNEELRPITTTTTTTTTVGPESTTEDLFQTNIFLKSLVAPKKNEHNNMNTNKILEEPIRVSHNKITAETKADKVPKLVPYQPKPHNEPKPLKKKPSMDLSDLISYINMKNHFESSKVKPKYNYGFSNYDNKNDMRYYETNEDDEEDYNIPPPRNNLRSMHNQEQEELRGIIKNYKVLQRNNHARHSEMNAYQNRKESPSMKISQSAGLPPLGRAGPSMKTYLPPIYV